MAGSTPKILYDAVKIIRWGRLMKKCPKVQPCALAVESLPQVSWGTLSE
jgi:hypothetical protein